jgi:ADP-dependent NAD(P)H-hydrate dehydratase / NAD(P)H-hydrate epimerase
LKLVTVAEMQTVEKEANSLGITYERMMENAGRGLAEIVENRFGSMSDGGIFGLVGSGNNGGDTLVALARLAKNGWRTTAYIVGKRPKKDSLVMQVKSLQGTILHLDEDPNLGNLKTALVEHKILVDGILGTGIKLPLRGKIAEVLKFVKDFLDSSKDRMKVIAVDCPSGVDCDSGEAAEETIPADLTVTMAAVKTGLLAFPANNYVGELILVEIGLDEIDGQLATWNSVKRRVVTADWAREILPPRPRDSHKGTFGTALIIAGSKNFTGAALLAGKAAYRVGAGLVSLAIPEPLHAALAGQFPEATWLLLPDEMGVISGDASVVIVENLGRATAILLGPGFGLEHETERFLSRLLTKDFHDRGIGFLSFPSSEKKRSPTVLPPLVIDADGLKLLSRLPDWQYTLPSFSILTPHPGEMAVLTGLDVNEIQSNRLQIAERFASEWEHIVVLKGANTIIASPDGQSTIVPVATPALARAGSGDVLAGLIVGLRAQSVNAFEAAVCGCWLHAQSGLEAAKLLGTNTSVLAGDLLAAVIKVIGNLERGLN